jgi:hypothetical protein
MIDYCDTVPLQLRQLDRRELMERYGAATRILRHAIVHENWRLVESAGLMLARIARRIRQQSGQALVEAAFVLPVLVLIIMGGVGVSAGILDRQILHAAAAEAARYGTLALEDGRRIPLEEVRAHALAGARGLVLSRDPGATVTATGLSRGDTLTVSMEARTAPILLDFGTVRAAFVARYQ